jgi:hypothetical protein
MICANCSSTVDSNFCPTCGQSRQVHRITVAHVVHEGIHSITHADKGFLLLVKQLLKRPGFLAKEYIEGKRKKYFNPVSFLVISTAFFAYFGSVTGYMNALTTANSASAGGRPISPLWRESFQIAAQSGKWLTLLLIAPLFAFLSWIFFIRKKYNYAEHFVLHSFIFGEAALFRLLIFVPLFLIVPEKTSILNLYVYEAFFLAFVTVAYKQFFNQHILLVILKVVLIRILFVVFFWALIYGFVVVKHAVL